MRRGLATMILLLLWISPLRAAEEPERPCAPDDELCWEALEQPEILDPTPFAVEPEPTVIALPCRVQWAAVTTCELMDKTGAEKQVPCVPIAYHVFVRQPPAMHTSAMTSRVEHPTTEVTCEALNLKPSVHYAIGVRAAGLAADFGVPVKPGDLADDVHVFVTTQEDRLPPSPPRLSVTTKR